VVPQRKKPKDAVIMGFFLKFAKKGATGILIQLERRSGGLYL